MAERGSPEWRRNVSAGTRRGQKPWRDGLRVLPRHVRALHQRHQVHESVRVMVDDGVTLIGEYVTQLGGVEALTAGQRVGLKALFRASVIVDAAFSRVLRDGDLRALEHLGPIIQAERAAVAALGLKRLEAPVPTLGEYVAERYQGSEDAPDDGTTSAGESLLALVEPVDQGAES